MARLSRGMVDGLPIVLPRGLPEYVGQLRAEGFPFVHVGLGHRRIGLITGRTDVGASHERLAGYREALTSAGQPSTRIVMETKLVLRRTTAPPRGVSAS